MTSLVSSAKARMSTLATKAMTSKNACGNFLGLRGVGWCRLTDA